MEKKNENNFFIIISILTLLAMILGASFAYYASVVIPDDDYLDVASRNLELHLTITSLYTEKKIIPTNDFEIDTAFENQCIDIHDFGACYAYNIELNNVGVPQDVTGVFKLTSDKLVNLKYMFLDADNENQIFQDVSDASEEGVDVGDNIHLETGESRHLILIIWLSNLEDIQNDEIAGIFNGEFTVRSTYGSKVTGTISAAN